MSLSSEFCPDDRSLLERDSLTLVSDALHLSSTSSTNILEFRLLLRTYLVFLLDFSYLTMYDVPRRSKKLFATERYEHPSA